MNIRRLIFSGLISLFFQPVNLIAEIIITDDSGTEIRLPQPAQRIISLAPNLTELLYAAGAGNKIIATVRHSDYPESAKEIPHVGDSHSLDLEAIMLLDPDLILLWSSGTGDAAFRKLIGLGFTVYRFEPDSLEKIASSIERFGQLAGTEDIANRSSRHFIDRLSALRKEYSKRSPVRVFYQFWDQPAFTVNGNHLISHVIALCAGANVFSGLATLTPQVSLEAVLTANPEVIIASGAGDSRPVWLGNWMQWPELAAAADNHLYFIPPDLVQRHTPRIIEGAGMMCEFIDRARN